MAKENNKKALKIYEEPETQLKFAQKAANALVKIVEEANACVDIQGNKFLKFEGWQMLARFFGYTVGIEKTEKLPNGYSARAIVYDREGKIIGSAEACCLRDEKNWSMKPDYQLKSMAQTRAASKALRNILGWVAVLAKFQAVPAEEVEPSEEAEIREAQKKKEITLEDLEGYLKTIPIPENEKKKAVLSLYGFDTLKWPEELVEQLPEPGTGESVYILAQREDGSLDYQKFTAMSQEQKKYFEWFQNNTNLKMPEMKRMSKEMTERYLFNVFNWANRKGIKVPTKIE
jgi:hypothetical protein